MNEYVQHKRVVALDLVRQRIHKDVNMISEREKAHLNEEDGIQEEAELPLNFELTDTGLVFNKLEKMAILPLFL